MMKPEEAWQAVLGELELSLGRSTYATWLQSARLVTYEDGQFVIGVSNGYAKEWLEQRKRAEVQKLLSERLGRSVNVRFVVLQHVAARDTAPIQRAEPAHDGLMNIMLTKQPQPSATSRNLLPEYTFETFVVGAGNRFAHAVSMAVAEQPANKYNPLFIYGGTGLGKTHLLHAIGNSVTRRGLACCYITTETFVNEFIAALRSQSQQEFREKYRNVDLLLVDDVQFLARTEFAQEEFFHTFNTLQSAQKQIVLTSDRTPKRMITLEERLRSRFEWGLMVEVSPPDLETRIAILQHKAEQRGAKVPPDVLEFVARQIQSNVRELEGALNRLLATSEVLGRPLTIQFARDALGDIFGRHINVSPTQVVEIVAEYYKLTVQEMTSPARNKELVLPRQVAMYLLRQETDASLPEIGALLGGRDHTTVIHGVERIKERLETDDQLRRDLMYIRERLYVSANPES